MAKDTVKTSILIISDTHAGAPHGAFGATSPPLPPADLLIHCGDLTMTGAAAEYEQTLDMLARIEAPVKLVIAGNHDLTLDGEFMQSHAGDARILSSSSSGDDDAEARWKAARALWTDPAGRAAREGVTFLDEGTHRVALANGARAVVYASPYTPEFLYWGLPYARDADRFNAPGASFRDVRNVARAPVPSFSPDDHEGRVDIMVTHGPLWGRLDQVPSGAHAGAAPLHTGCSNLLRALMRARPLLHCFGHIHEGHGAERIEWSGAADAVATAPAGRGEWEGGDAWEEGVQLGRDGIATVDPDTGSGDGVIAADVSTDAESPLVRGRDTLLVNASIMTVNYRPENRPWFIELDLPTA